MKAQQAGCRNWEWANFSSFFPLPLEQSCGSHQDMNFNLFMKLLDNYCYKQIPLSAGVHPN
ncbi:MAG: hypothetical protein Q8761_03040, partial [Sweet potato little leaf phytoplasma]|nr:hypothetical protein [Sweet potato little leaf phytoplasma]